MRDVELLGGFDEAACLSDHQKRSREIDVHGTARSTQGVETLSIEIFDSRHRKIPFEDGIDSHHIEDRLDSSRVRFGSAAAERSMEGLTNMAKAAKKPAAKKAAAKKPAAKKKK